MGLAVAVLLFYGQIADIGPIELVTDYFERNLQLTMRLYESMGLPEESVRMASELLEDIQSTVIRVIPSMVVTLTILTTWLNLLVARPIFKAAALFYPDFGHLNRWKAPDILVWTVIGCGLLLLLPNPHLKIVARNGIIILMTVYFLQGIAIMSFYFTKKGVPKVPRILLYSLVAIHQGALFLVIGLGFFDFWVNFRRLEPRKDH
jgi:uncharacterized protein YybS (DUF2232 family)